MIPATIRAQSKLIVHLVVARFCDMDRTFVSTTLEKHVVLKSANATKVEANVLIVTGRLELTNYVFRHGIKKQN